MKTKCQPRLESRANGVEHPSRSDRGVQKGCSDVDCPKHILPSAGGMRPFTGRIGGGGLLPSLTSPWIISQIIRGKGLGSLR